jgi:hypothetical protein
MQLVIVDTTQIQPYVFGSNRLRENAGASHLVAQATGAWALDFLPKPNNVKFDGTLGDGKHIERSGDNLAAEVIYSGGGNLLVLFQDQGNDGNEAKAFTRALSRKALEEAPDLQMVFARHSFDWKDSLYEAVRGTFKQLATEKRSRVLSAPLLGLGVTAVCQSTGLPATAMANPVPTDPGSAYAASAEIISKLDATDPANKRLREMFKAVLGDQFAFPLDFDKMGRSSGEHSYIAIVHADGNSMGDRIQKIGKANSEPGQNRNYIIALRAFSTGVEQVARLSLQDILLKLTGRIHNGTLLHKNSSGDELARIELGQDDGQSLLPLRPIVFGGDDVTFVCDGRLGLSLAVEYLSRFEAHSKDLSLGGLTSSAGVAIVKSHYPFARAYALAEELCGSAKSFRRKLGIKGSCLDWHFALSGLSGDITTIRDREYKVDAGSLTLRPVTLTNNPAQPQRAWPVVLDGAMAFQGKDWASRRNKLKALRETLRQGPDSTKWFLEKFGISGTLPKITGYPDFETTGWAGDRCGYFDAIELADWFISL